MHPAGGVSSGLTKSTPTRQSDREAILGACRMVRLQTNGRPRATLLVGVIAALLLSSSPAGSCLSLPVRSRPAASPKRSGSSFHWGNGRPRVRSLPGQAARPRCATTTPSAAAAPPRADRAGSLRSIVGAPWELLLAISACMLGSLALVEAWRARRRARPVARKRSEDAAMVKQANELTRREQDLVCVAEGLRREEAALEEGRRQVANDKQRLEEDSSVVGPTSRDARRLSARVTRSSLPAGASMSCDRPTLRNWRQRSADAKRSSSGRQRNRASACVLWPRASQGTRRVRLTARTKTRCGSRSSSGVSWSYEQASCGSSVPEPCWRDGTSGHASCSTPKQPTSKRRVGVGTKITPGSSSGAAVPPGPSGGPPAARRRRRRTGAGPRR